MSARDPNKARQQLDHVLALVRDICYASTDDEAQLLHQKLTDLNVPQVMSYID